MIAVFLLVLTCYLLAELACRLSRPEGKRCSCPWCSWYVNDPPKHGGKAVTIRGRPIELSELRSFKIEWECQVPLYESALLEGLLPLRGVTMTTPVKVELHASVR